MRVNSGVLGGFCSIQLGRCKCNRAAPHTGLCGMKQKASSSFAEEACAPCRGVACR